MPYKDPVVRQRHKTEWMRKYRLEHSEDYNEYQRKYYHSSESYRLKTKVYGAKRRARIQATDVGDVDYIKMFEEWDRICGICKDKVLGEYEFDHIIPLSRGGAHEKNNLQITHRVCNRRKWAN